MVWLPSSRAAPLRRRRRQQQQQQQEEEEAQEEAQAEAQPARSRLSEQTIFKMEKFIVVTDERAKSTGKCSRTICSRTRSRTKGAHRGRHCVACAPSLCSAPCTRARAYRARLTHTLHACVAAAPHARATIDDFKMEKFKKRRSG